MRPRPRIRTSARIRFGHRLLGNEFGRLVRDEPETLVRLVVDVGIVHVNDCCLDDPARDLERIARGFGEPILYNGPALGPCIELTNRENTPELERDKAVEWHQDDIHTPVPASFTMLYCLEAPHDPPATKFADLRRPFHVLDDATRSALKGLLIRHDPIGGAVRSQGESTGRVGHVALDSLTHPLVLQHPRTGLPQLFALAGTAAGIVGKTDNEAHQILRKLKNYVTGAEYVTEVRLTSRSLVVWDNLAILHTATPVRYSDLDGERRRLLRVSVR